MVDGRRVRRQPRPDGDVADWTASVLSRAALDGAVVPGSGSTATWSGAILLADPLRPDARERCDDCARPASPVW